MNNSFCRNITPMSACQSPPPLYDMLSLLFHCNVHPFKSPNAHIIKKGSTPGKYRFIFSMPMLAKPRKECPAKSEKESPKRLSLSSNIDIC